MIGVRLEGVTKYFTDRETGTSFHAVGPVDLEIPSGEFICLLGPSGCGKSTLLNLVSQFEKTDQGKVTFLDDDGHAIPGDSKYSNLVFQEYALFPWRRVIDNVTFGPEVRGVSRSEALAEARKYIDLVGLNGFENRYPYELSGGMKQRVAIARALANKPFLLLMDEPFASVDAQTRDLLHLELIKIWEQEKKTIIFVTHNIEEAIMLGERVAVLTARPGKVKDIVKVDLPRPRELEIRGTAAFAEIYRRILKSIKDEVLKAAKEMT